MSVTLNTLGNAPVLNTSLVYPLGSHHTQCSKWARRDLGRHVAAVQDPPTLRLSMSGKLLVGPDESPHSIEAYNRSFAPSPPHSLPPPHHTPQHATYDNGPLKLSEGAPPRRMASVQNTLVVLKEGRGGRGGSDYGSGYGNGGYGGGEGHGWKPVLWWLSHEGPRRRSTLRVNLPSNYPRTFSTSQNVPRVSQGEGGISLLGVSIGPCGAFWSFLSPLVIQVTCLAF